LLVSAACEAGAGSASDTNSAQEDNDWKQLSELYKQLEETDIVRGLYDKFSCHPDTKEALAHELDGKYSAAKELYLKLLDMRDRVEEGADSWPHKHDPTELEENLWEDGYEDSMEKAHEWGELKEWYEDKVGKDEFETSIWEDDNRRLLHLHLACLIGTCALSSPTTGSPYGGMSAEWKEFAGMIEEKWFSDERASGGERRAGAPKAILRDEFEHPTALALLVCNPPNRVQAKELINGALSRFLSDWSSSSESGQVARRGKIRHLQKVVELLEFNEAGDQVEKQLELVRLWGSRVPRKSQLGDVESWDAILMSRLTLLRAMSIDPRVSEAAVETLRTTYLAMSSLARR